MTVRTMVLAASLLFVSSTARAETYRVAQGHSRASDANSGTEEAPWKTVAKAAAELLPGDTAVIHAGVYREWVNPARSGSGVDASRVPGRPRRNRGAQRRGRRIWLGIGRGTDLEKRV